MLIFLKYLKMYESDFGINFLLIYRLVFFVIVNVLLDFVCG